MRRTTRGIGFVGLLVACGALLSPSIAVAGEMRAAPRIPVTWPVRAASYADEVVRLTNVERTRNGCPALAVQSTLTQVAQAHSTDMATHNYFSHTGRDGRSPFDRMTDAGYRYRAAAENIAAGQRTPAEVVTAWMNSAGHRANILNCALRQIGVGYGYSASSAYRTYWTQDFGTPR